MGHLRLLALSKAASGPATFRFEAYSLKLVTDVFPGAQDKHFFHVYFTQQLEMFDEAGRRYTNQELYGSDKLLAEHEKLLHDLLDCSASEVVVVWGGPARRWFQKEFDLSSDGKYEIVDGVDVGGIERTKVFLSHPGYIARWADDGIPRTSGQAYRTSVRPLRNRDRPVPNQNKEALDVQHRRHLGLLACPGETGEELANRRESFLQANRMRTGLAPLPGEEDFKARDKEVALSMASSPLHVTRFDDSI